MCRVSRIERTFSVQGTADSVLPYFQGLRVNPSVQVGMPCVAFDGRRESPAGNHIDLNQMHDDGSARFARACTELERISRINHTGVEVCIEHFNAYPDDAQATEMLAQSLAFAMRQPFHLSRELLLLCLDTEEAAASQSA